MNYFMGFDKNKFDACFGRLFMRVGVVLSALAIAMFFLDVSRVMAFTEKPEATAQCDTNSSQCDMEDETEEDGQNSPTLVSFSKNNFLSPAFSFLTENFRLATYGNQSPPDFPPELI
jgi:hypothetical protein